VTPLEAFGKDGALRRPGHRSAMSYQREMDRINPRKLRPKMTNDYRVDHTHNEIQPSE